ncbi:transposase [Streptomyces sp. M-16]|uniref:transposase n=1 Tax=Streptomyces sp. M-16 TaxID=3233040 RepID=UPI003F9DDD1B
MVITAGQRGDSRQFEQVLEAIRVPRLRLGRTRNRPDRVRADKAYDSRSNRPTCADAGSRPPSRCLRTGSATGRGADRAAGGRRSSTRTTTRSTRSRTPTHMSPLMGTR